MRTHMDSRQSWKIVAACFVIKFLSFGLVEVSGLFMVASMNVYDTSRKQASLPYTLVYFIRNGIGPLIAYLGYVFGIRKTTLIGCITSSVAVGACFFVEDITAMTITWGIVFGCGFAFETLLLDAILVEHFEKDISKATGITNAGSQIGIGCFSLFIQFILKRIGFPGTFLIISGITLNAIPAILYIILNKPNKASFYSTDKKLNFDSNSAFKVDISSVNNVNNNDDKSMEEKPGAKEKCYVKEIDKSGVRRSHSVAVGDVGNLRNFSSNNVSITLSIPKLYSKHNNLSKDCGQKQTSDVQSVASFNITDQNKTNTVETFRTKLCKLKRIFVDINLFKEKNNEQHSFERQISCTPSEQKETNKRKQRPTFPLYRLFNNPTFFLLLISGGVHYFTIPSLDTVIVDYAINIGIEVSITRYILVWSTASDLTGSILLGFLADRRFMRSNAFAAACFAGECIALVLLSWVRHYIFLAAVITIFQFSQSGITLVYPIVVSEAVDKDLKSSVLASLFVLAAPLDLIIPQLIGYILDDKGSYAGFFYTLAGATFLGAFVHLCILKVEKLKNAKSSSNKVVENI